MAVQEAGPGSRGQRAYAAYSAGEHAARRRRRGRGRLRTAVGAPYDSFPTAYSKYGGAGVSGWGTLCGALNGVAAALYLFLEQKNANPIINEVYGWYGVTALPDYTPVKPKFATIQKSVADSQLCHQSVTKWCDASGFKTTSTGASRPMRLDHHGRGAVHGGPGEQAGRCHFQTDLCRSSFSNWLPVVPR